MKHNLGCHKFEDNCEVITIVTQWLITLDTGNIKLVPRHDKCLNCGVYNVENLCYSIRVKCEPFLLEMTVKEVTRFM